MVLSGLFLLFLSKHKDRFWYEVPEGKMVPLGINLAMIFNLMTEVGHEASEDVSLT